VSPVFSIAGKQLGSDDGARPFPRCASARAEIERARFMLENVPGFASPKFTRYRSRSVEKFRRLRLFSSVEIINAADFVSRNFRLDLFSLLFARKTRTSLIVAQARLVPRDCGASDGDLVASRGLEGSGGLDEARGLVAPGRFVGGSKKHGGPDLGPTRAREQWLQLRVDGIGIADNAPSGQLSRAWHSEAYRSYGRAHPGFPDDWQFAGGKRQHIGKSATRFPRRCDRCRSAILAAFEGLKPSYEREQIGDIRSR